MVPPTPKPEHRDKPRAAKQVLITINKAGLDEWNRFEEYCKEYNINKSGLMRQLVHNFLMENVKSDDPSAVVAGNIFD